MPQTHRQPIDRRQFLRAISAAGGLMALGALAACGPGAPQPPAPTAASSKPADSAAPAAAKPTDAAKPVEKPAAGAPAAPAAQGAPAVTSGIGPKGTVNVVQGPEIRTLDGTMEVALNFRNAIFHLYDPLFTRDDKMKPSPHLATGFEVLDDGKRMRLKLRPNVKFHDGAAFTAEDVKYSLDRVRDPAVKSQHFKYTSSIADVLAVDPQTVDIVLKQYDATIPARLTMISMVSKAWATTNGPDKLVTQAMGTGAWKLKEWKLGQQMVLEANPNYWGGPPPFESIVWKSIGEDTTRAATAQTGQAEVVISIPPTLVDQVNSGGKSELRFVHSLRNAFITPNAYKKPFDDVRVRKALNHAVNVDLYIQSIFGGHAFRTAGMFGPLVFGFNPDLKPYEYSPDKAKQLLAEAGYPNGFDTTFTYRTDGELAGEAEMVQAMVGDLAKVGIRTKLEPVQFNTYVDKYARQLNMDADLFMNTNANNDADANYNLVVNVYSKGQAPDRTGYYWPTPPDVDEAIVKGRTILDPNQREQHYRQLMQRIYDEAIWVFMFDMANTYAISKRLKNVTALADETMLLHKASWVE